MKVLYKKLTETKVNIIDTIMGRGKTSWAIQYINEAPFCQKFIYITPFLMEVERVIQSCNRRRLIQPEASNGRRKLDHFKALVKNGEDIVSTHALFQNMDSELMELLRTGGYTLILDEAMNVIEQVDISQDDLHILLTTRTRTGDPMITVNEDGFIHWNDSSYQEGMFTRIRNLIGSNRLMLYNDTAMYWLFPAEAFQAFKQVYVLTYMFKGQLQRHYYDLFHFKYEYYSVTNREGRYDLIPHIPLHLEDRRHLKELINIFYPSIHDKTDINKVGESRYTFSLSSLKKLIKNNISKKEAKNHAYNFYRNKCKVPSEAVMWTTFLGANDEIKKRLAPKNLKKQFVEVTCRATNEYANKSVCIYLANRFMNPVMKQFFISKGVQVDEDLFALSELLQWLFRSRIRRGESIKVYIPSCRMRNLLESYLDNN